MENISFQPLAGSFSLTQGKGVDSQIYEVITVGPDGRVTSTGIFGGLSPDPGPTDDGGYVIYIYTCQEIDTSELVKYYYYDFDTNVFVRMPDRPHEITIWDYPSKSWMPNQEEYNDIIETTKQRLLYLTDWIHVPDTTISSDNKALGVTYRQEVRNFEVTNEDDYLKPIEDLDWPIVPDFLKKNKQIKAASRMFHNQ
jgi:hypothetical protein